MLEKHWNSISLPSDELEIIMLCSDGFLPYEETSPEELPGLAHRIIANYMDKGMTLGRMMERRENQDEATAIVLLFD